ncbi:MAG TPA: response regulator transcription factor [Polyangiaceae bacterium]
MAARFLLVEDHEPLAQTLASAARCVGTVNIAPTVARGMEYVLETSEWAGFVIDVMMPDGNGLDVLAFARERGVVAPALVLTALHDAATINRAYELEGRYLVKPADPLRILQFFSSAARQPTTEQLAREWGDRYALTETEIAVLVAAAEGSPRDQVAFERGIATTTLKTHVHNLLRKTGDGSLLAAAARLLRDRER